MPTPAPDPKPDPMPTPTPDPKPDPMPTPAPDPKPDPMPTPAPDPKPDPMPMPTPLPIDPMEDYLSLRLLDTVRCEDGMYCASIQIKAELDSFMIGTSSIFMTYDKEVLAFKYYESTAFDGSSRCIANVASAWNNHAIDGTSVPGKINLTLSLTSREFSCPVIKADQWIEIGVVCFEMKQKENPMLTFDKANTSFNRNSPNDGTRSPVISKMMGKMELMQCNTYEEDKNKTFLELEDELNEDSKFLIRAFPNPFSQTFTIDLSGLKASVNVMLFNIQGQLIWQKNLSPDIHVIGTDLDQLSPGFYFLKADVAQGQQIIKIQKN